MDSIIKTENIIEIYKLSDNHKINDNLGSYYISDSEFNKVLNRITKDKITEYTENICKLDNLTIKNKKECYKDKQLEFEILGNLLIITNMREYIDYEADEVPILSKYEEEYNILIKKYGITHFIERDTKKYIYASFKQKDKLKYISYITKLFA